MRNSLRPQLPNQSNLSLLFSWRGDCFHFHSSDGSHLCSIDCFSEPLHFPENNGTYVRFHFNGNFNKNYGPENSLPYRHLLRYTLILYTHLCLDLVNEPFSDELCDMLFSRVKTLTSLLGFNTATCACLHLQGQNLTNTTMDKFYMHLSPFPPVRAI